ncbi:MAG: hypothetical protein NTU60_04565 [Candidatus Aminicenantes bacterium]|nr:hypothetical protein [Candidatus Aminicenantes bacterium]
MTEVIPSKEKDPLGLIMERIIELRDPKSIYETRIAARDAAIARLRKADRFYISLKLVLFFGGLWVVSQFFPARIGLSLLFFALFSALFAGAAFRHERVLRKIRFARTLRRINEDEILALAGEFVTNVKAGEEFIDPAHPYSSDLDLFGERSLFHLLNRATTDIGRRALAGLLLSPQGLRRIRDNQAAVRELAGKLDFRQMMRAHGLTMDDTAQKQALLAGLLRVPAGIPGSKAFTALLFALPLLTIASLVLTFFGVPWVVLASLFLCQAAINRVFGRRIGEIHSATSRHFRVLRSYADIIRDIEQEPFASARLREMQSRLTAEGLTASRAIKKLASLLEWLDARSNRTVHFFLNNIFFWDLHCARRIEKWRDKTAVHVPGWFETLGAVEALAGPANLAFNNPGWAFPRIEEAGFLYRAASLGHPLIPREERVSNDFALEKKGDILIVTGPNMAGKSTFLRTLGVNAVLAFAGAPVCAAAMEVTPFRLVTGMKSSDSLDKHMSLFYAELLRLKLILDTLKDDPGAFFMIDEMLKGTNALDRHKGSVALTEQLIRRGATGIVATHDIELTHLEQGHPNVRNFHFEGTVRDDRLVFDFKLKPGICESFNALLLMKKIGIEV